MKKHEATILQESSTANTGSANLHISNTTMWVDKYEPRNMDDLAVAPKKVQEIRQWLEHFSPPLGHGLGPERISPKMLILVGSPGIGKSTLIRVLAREFHWQLLQWNNNENTGGGYSDFQNESSRYGNTNESYNHDGLPFHNQYIPTNQLSSLQEFLHSASMGYNSLEISSKSSKPEARSTKTSSMGSSSSSVLKNHAKQKKVNHSKKRLLPSSKPENDDISSDEDDDDRFSYRKSIHTNAVLSSSKVLHNSGQFQFQSILLIEELPTLHSVEVEENFRHILSEYIHMSQIPIVLIFSDVYEGKHRPEDLERIVDRNILYSPLVTIIQIHPVTKQNMKKCLELILRNEEQEKIGNDSRARNVFVKSTRKRRNKSTIPNPPEIWLEEIHTISGGDIRHAIMMLQFQYVGGHLYSGRTDRTTNISKMEKHQRDVTLSTFHALGKLLYAKRRVASTDNNQQRETLDFDPEQVIEGCAIGLSGALAFLGYHSPIFFSDIMELSNAFDAFSDAAYFMDKVYDGLVDSVYPNGYAASFASRAVAGSNKQPAAHRFHQFSSPKYFEVMKARGRNKEKILQLCKRISSCEERLTLGINTTAFDEKVTQSLFFYQKIMPSVSDSALSIGYSRERDIGSTESEVAEGGRDFNLETEMIQKQNEILLSDDIVDSDDETYKCRRDACREKSNVDYKETSNQEGSILKFSGQKIHDIIVLSD